MFTLKNSDELNKSRYKYSIDIKRDIKASKYHAIQYIKWLEIYSNIKQCKYLLTVSYIWVRWDGWCYPYGP